MTKYSDLLARWLAELGYTHCFFVAGGNIMHLLESCSRTLACIPVVHEVAAGIAAEYFNEVHLTPAGTPADAAHPPARAFALVTAGPGLTNILTALAGAWLESRELLVLGGQVKLPDLRTAPIGAAVRQRGIQEIDGVALAAPITTRSQLIDRTLTRAQFATLITPVPNLRKGPIFLELPLDIQGSQVDESTLAQFPPANTAGAPGLASETWVHELAQRLRHSQRPVLLIGAGLTRATAALLTEPLAHAGIPTMLTWNAADRLDASHPVYFGRPNTWGMRRSNILLQQADLVLALGTRLSLQQTGFNWQSFVPAGDVIHVDIDQAELTKGHPKLAEAIQADCNPLLTSLLQQDLGDHTPWVDFCRDVERTLPLVEPGNHTGPGFLSPFRFVETLSILCTPDDLIIPCSSGGAFTVMMQTFAQKAGQRIVTNKGLASMGYGLSGAIGAAFAGRAASPPRRTILVEGDGGFTQNLQELGTVRANRLPLKIFLFDDNGYASIRMTQRNYFGGRYVGCDTETGLGLPLWEPLFAAYSIPVLRLHSGFESNPAFLAAFNAPTPAAFLVPIDPTQTYFPKITSRITPSGSMESNPLHRMSPDLDPALAAKVFRFLQP